MNRNEKHRKRGWLKRTLLIGLTLAVFSAPALAQSFVYRVDPTPVMTTRGNVPAGGFPQLYVVPGATITLCTDAACTIPATTYTNAIGDTSCPTTAQVTLPGSALCTSTSGPQGQFGFWIQPGTYYYQIRAVTGTFGPFPISSPTVGTLGGPGIVSANPAGGLVPMSSNLDCSLFSGASASLKITACLAALSSGGTLDSSAMTGAQSITSPITISQSHVTLRFGASQFSVSSKITVSGDDVHIDCYGTKFTYPNGQATGTLMIQMTGAFNTVRGCSWDGNKAGVASQPDTAGSWNSGAPRIYYTPIDIEGASDAHIEGNYFVNVSTAAVNFNNCTRCWVEKNTFLNSYMDPIFTNLGSGQTSQYVHINNNTIQNVHYASCNSISTACYGNGMIVDASDLEITGNLIDTTDRSCLKPTDAAATRILVANNTCRNISTQPNGGYAGMSVQGDTASDVTYANNILSNLGGGGIAINGLIGAHMARVQIIGNKISTTGTVGTATNQQCIAMLYTDEALISGNQLDACDVSAVRIYDSTDVTITGNHIHGVTLGTGDCIDIAGAAGSNRMVISGNTIISCARSGMLVEDATTNLTIVRNIIRTIGAGGGGITINNTAGTVDLIENEVYSSGGYGISHQVAGNVIRNKVFTASTYCYVLASPSITGTGNVAENCGTAPYSFTGTPVLLDGQFYDSVNKRLAVGPAYVAPTGTLSVKDATATTGSTSLYVQSGEGQSTNPYIVWQDHAGNDLFFCYDKQDPTCYWNRSDSGKIALQFRGANTVKEIIGLAGADGDIGTGSKAGDFVIRSASASTALAISTNGSNACRIFTGSGSPNSAVTGSPCDVYLNASGGAGTTLYVKESGSGTNTGWVGK